MTATCPACLAPNARFALKTLLYRGCARDIYDCPDCGASFHHPLPSLEDIARCYPPFYFQGFFRQYWKDYYKGRALAKRLLPWRRSGSFLDVGCALGTLLAGMRDHSGWKVSGLEFSETAAAMGRELNHVEIACAGLAQAPWPDACYDCIHINNVLEHESEPEAAVRAAARLLNPGGRLLLTIPNGPVDILANRLLYAKHGPLATRHGGHLFFFSRRSLKLLLERCGLEVLSIRCFHFKLGAKARGWLPGSWRKFLAQAPKSWAQAEEGCTLEQGRKLIGPQPSWMLYWLLQQSRRLWRLPYTDFGYDLEVIAQRF